MNFREFSLRSCHFESILSQRVPGTCRYGCLRWRSAPPTSSAVGCLRWRSAPGGPSHAGACAPSLFGSQCRRLADSHTLAQSSIFKSGVWCVSQLPENKYIPKIGWATCGSPEIFRGCASGVPASRETSEAQMMNHSFGDSAQLEVALYALQAINAYGGTHLSLTVRTFAHFPHTVWLPFKRQPSLDSFRDLFCISLKMAVSISNV